MISKQEASRDLLTGLNDRRQLLSFLPRVLENQARLQSSAALLIVDVDKFHRVNSLYGYAVGDQLLKKLAELLLMVSRPQDHVFRIGDNRFALILMDIMNSGHAELAAQKIQRSLDIPFSLGSSQIKLDCTIGISLFSARVDNAEMVFKDAENRLYEARELGQGISIAENALISEAVPDNWAIEADLQSAIDNHELELYYQPQISMQSGLPVGAEALLRWQHPERGLVSPDIFIPIAERTGQINKITNWVLNRVMRESAAWTACWGQMTVSVNIPPDFIMQPLLKDFIASSIKLWKGENITLMLEIIERSLIKDPERCFDHLTEIRDMGVRISIDDFGTGYSTLSYFQFIPVDELKIDQSFVLGLPQNQGNQNIVRLVTDLAHSFGMTVVAEGIENEAVARCIASYSVDVGQGYHFAKPMPAYEFAQWLREFKTGFGNV